MSPRKARDVASWPLALIALPAGVATWSGWVGLGRFTGFGQVTPLPGIADHFTIDTAITLPVGVEAYAAYALGAWLSATPHTKGTRRFAAVSAVGSLILGMAGQVAYHLLETSGRTRAPWWIVTLVSCLPVLVLGMGATLRHMLHRDRAARMAEEAATSAIASDTVTGASVADTRLDDRTRPLADDRPVTEEAAPEVVDEDSPPSAGALAAELPAVAAAETGHEVAENVTESDVTGPLVTGHMVAERVTDDRPRLAGQSEWPRALAAGQVDRSSAIRPASGQELVLADTDRDALVISWLSADPDLSGAEIARRLSVAPRTGQRLRDRLSGVLQGVAS